MTRRAPLTRIALTLAAVAAAVALVASHGVAQQAAAQTEKRPGLFKAQEQKRDEPVRITAATLEVRDKSKMATFNGDVHVVQGDTDVRCNRLVVFYDNEKSASAAQKTSDGGRGGSQQIRRMEAYGSVVVTQKEQRAVGDRAEFDMRTNTVTLIGNVVVTNADNIVRGQRMVVDLTTGVARMGETGGGRVEGIFNSKPQPKPGKHN